MTRCAASVYVSVPPPTPNALFPCVAGMESEHAGDTDDALRVYVCVKKGPVGKADKVSRLKDINTHCLEEFRRHWTCLENGNQQLWQCRPQEWKLNKCVYENLVSDP